MSRQIKFKVEKDTKNTVKYEEIPQPGQPKIIGSLYLQKFFVEQNPSLKAGVTITIDEAAAA